MPVPFSTAPSDEVSLRLVRDGDGVRLSGAQVENQRHLALRNSTRDAEFFTEKSQEADVSKRPRKCKAGTGLPMVLVSA